MNQLTKIFDNQELTVIESKGEPKFLLKDICKILDLSNPRQVKTRLEEDVISNYALQTAGGTQQATFVNEDGLYDVILDSRKPEAKNFRKWITSEVIPSIRKTGSYINENIVPLSEKQSLIAMMKLTTLAAEETEELKKTTSAHSEKLKELEEKVENEITLDHGEQRRLQKAVAAKVYQVCSDSELRPKLFSEIYREIKDRFGVASYKDVKRQELQSAIQYVNHWIPRKVAV